MIPPGDVPLDRPFLRATAHRSDAAADTSRGGGAGARMRRRVLCEAARRRGSVSSAARRGRMAAEARMGALSIRAGETARGREGLMAGARARGGALSHPEIFEFQGVIKIKNNSTIFS